MPGCVLHVAGTELDLDDCLGLVGFELDNVFYKGEPRIKQKPDGPMNDKNEFTVLVSDDDSVSIQVKDAERFLENHLSVLTQFKARKDVEETYLDFGWEFPIGEDAVLAQFNHFPPRLLRLCGELNIGIEVSVYASK